MGTNDTNRSKIIDQNDKKLFEAGIKARPKNQENIKKRINNDISTSFT